MNWPKHPPNKPSPESGQGFTEYAIILMLVGVSVVLIVTVMGPALEGVFSRLARQERMAPPSLTNYTPPPTSTEDPSGGPSVSTATNTPVGWSPTETPTPSITPTATETPTALPTASATPTGTALPPLSNLCLASGATTTQSSTNSGGVSSRACDGNTNGDFGDGSVARTNNETNPYWEVDLGKTYVLQQLKIYNRTDADTGDLANFYVFTTNNVNGFSSTDINTTKNDPNVKSYQLAGDVDQIAFALNNVTATHIRIQLIDGGNLNLAEVEVIGATYIANECEALADMFYVFDVSGSMAGGFPPSTTKIQAAKDAVITVNNEIAASGGNSRIGFVTFTTNGYLYNPYRLSIDLDTIPLTTNIANVNAQVGNWQAVGGTPTGAALNAARLTMIDTWDPLRTPVVVLVSDGVPTVNQQGYYYYDPYVQNVDIYNNSGVPYSANYVANTGSWNKSGGFYASGRVGAVVADVMYEIVELTNSLPNATVHSIALGSGSFNTEVLDYVAEVGGGQSFSANDADSLANQLLSIFNSISCTPDS